eukprot:3926273-Karenia_brevis.AAC.1
MNKMWDKNWGKNAWGGRGSSSHSWDNSSNDGLGFIKHDWKDSRAGLDWHEREETYVEGVEE